MTKKTVTLKAIGLLQLAYKKEFDEQQLDFYVSMLADIPPAALAAGVTYCIQHSKFLPSIAEIREAAQTGINLASGTHAMTENEAWGLVQKAIRSVGMYEKPKFDSPILQQVVDRLGWKDICQTPTEDTGILRAQFRRAYEESVQNQQKIKDYQSAGVPVHQRYLQLDNKIQAIVGSHSMPPEQIDHPKEDCQLE